MDKFDDPKKHLKKFLHENKEQVKKDLDEVRKPMLEYKIYHPFKGNPTPKGKLELEIRSERLLYSEVQDDWHGLQCENNDNHHLIIEKCKKIVDLIREIEELNIK